jgi:hypothetical protein
MDESRQLQPAETKSAEGEFDSISALMARNFKQAVARSSRIEAL